MAERELDELFRSWRSEPVPPSLPASIEDHAGRAVVAAALRRVAEQKRQKSRVRRFGMALAVAAGLSGLGVGAWLEVGRGPVMAAAPSAADSVLVDARVGEVAVTDGVGHAVDVSSALVEGYGLRTEHGNATLGFPSGARAQVASESFVKITAAREKEGMFLARGGVDVEVPKLDPTRGFSVETPDAHVTVHGTRFSVKVEATASGPRTRVEVTRGIVSVQQAGREVFLKAGEVWPPRPAAEPADVARDVDAGAEPSDEAEPPPSDPGDAKRHGARTRGRRVRHFDSRELADQNERFARAMTLKKNDAPEAALHELTRLARRYPGSPLAQELSVERLRLLRGLGQTAEAAREARRYVRDFPEGYALPEAQELLSGQP